MIATTSGHDRSIVLLKQDEEGPDNNQQVTGSYGLHKLQTSLQIY
jgi:hypothetical protein